MNISPWSIYDQTFTSNENKKTIEPPSSPFKKQNKSPTKSIQVKQQPFYSYSTTKTFQKSCEMLLLIRLIRNQIAEQELKCLSLPKIVNPIIPIKKKPYIRPHNHRIKLIKMKQGLSQRIIQKIDQSNMGSKVVVFDYSPFSDEKILERKVQTERQRKMYQMQSIISYDMLT